MKKILAVVLDKGGSAIFNLMGKEGKMRKISRKVFFSKNICIGRILSSGFIVFAFVSIFLITTEIAHAESVFLASPGGWGTGMEHKVIEFDSITGTIVREFVNTSAPTAWTPTDVTLGFDGNLYVASQIRGQADLAEIIKIDLETGNLSVFATEGISGISRITVGPNGNLFASSSCGGCDAKVVEYDGMTGALVGTFIPGPSDGSGGIAFGPNGNLFVGRTGGEVVEYNGQTGDLVGTFASQGISGVNDLTFAPNGNLIVAAASSGLMEFDGVTGNLLRLIDCSRDVIGCSSDVRPVGVTFDTNGFLLVSSNIRYAPIREYEWPSGVFLGTYADNPTGFPHGIIAVNLDADGDGIPGNNDNCPDIANPGQEDSDSDGIGDACDDCPSDPNKTEAGICGCGVSDDDSDGDGTADCNDECPNDPNKVTFGICGCEVSDIDSDGDGTADCNDGCPSDIYKVAPGQCGCGNLDSDIDSDGIADCVDDCPNDAYNDVDQDGICGDVDNCPNIDNPNQEDLDGDGTGDICDDDADDDGFTWGADDCNDYDPTINPSATEIPYNGIDENCSGYDLTIDVTTADYIEKESLLTVKAISSYGESANLELVGYGPMIWRETKQEWMVDFVGANPGTVTVSGPEGSWTRSVVVE